MAAHILASHPAAGHLEVELAVVLGVERVLGAGVEQRTHRLVALKHQVDVACRANAALARPFRAAPHTSTTQLEDEKSAAIQQEEEEETVRRSRERGGTRSGSP